MKNFKKIQRVLLLCLLAGCNDITDHDPYDSIVPENFFNTRQDALAGIMGAYDALQTSSYYGREVLTFTELCTDNMTFDRGNYLQAFADNATTSTTDFIANFYQEAFIGINRANFVIQKVPPINDPMFTNREEIIGEAYFLKAFHYFLLVGLYGGVPVLTEPVSSINPEEISRARNTEAEVYDAIIAYLTTAEEMLPESYPTLTEDKGRATKLAATAMKARVYMEMGQWENAAAAAQQVINNGKVFLEDTHEKIFEGGNSNESIFELQYTAPEGEGSYSMAGYTLPVILGGRYNYVPSEELIALFTNENSPRSNFTLREVEDGGVVLPYINKYNVRTGLENIIVLRLAETYLILAEALARTGYPSQQALDLLNEIRIRAGVTPYTAAALSDQQSFMEALWLERRLELAYESFRRFDLYRRYRFGDETDKQIAMEDLGITNPARWLYPYPQIELDLDPKLEPNPSNN